MHTNAIFTINKLTIRKLQMHAIFLAYFAPAISEMAFAGILAAVNGQRLIILSLAEHITKVCAKVKTIVKVIAKVNLSVIF